MIGVMINHLDIRSTDVIEQASDNDCPGNEECRCSEADLLFKGTIQSLRPFSPDLKLDSERL